MQGSPRKCDNTRRLICPIWQCGGEMVTKERPPPYNYNQDEEYDGDWQTPDLVCTNCHARYKFAGFDKK